MNYYKLNLNSIFACLFITSIFFSDFGIVIFEQPIFLNQILAVGFLIILFSNSFKIEKSWLLFFIAIIISSLANILIISEFREFGGDTYPWTSIKNFLNVIIFYAVYKTTIFSYYKINANLFFYLSLLMVLYGTIEMFFGSFFSPYKNDLVIEILRFFHTNKSAAGHHLLSLLGREHSYGALGYNITACFMIFFYLRKTFGGIKSHFILPLILMLFFFSISTTSKTSIFSLFFLALLLLLLILKGHKKNLKLFLYIFLIIIFITILMSYFLNQGYHDNFYDTYSGNVGSGSTFSRWTSLKISWAMFLDNIFWGIGGGNFKLFYLEYVDLLNIPKILEIKTYSDPQNINIPNQLNFFIGILSEYGIFTFIIVCYFIFKKLLFLFFSKSSKTRNISIALLISPIIFSASMSVYYWAISFFPFYLALLEIDYRKYKNN